MVREVKKEFAPATDIKAGDCFLGIAKGYRTVPGVGMDKKPKESYIFTLNGLKDGQDSDLWGSNAAVIGALKEVAAASVVLVMHYGKVKRSTRFGDKDINDCRVWILEGREVEIASTTATLEGIRVTNPAVVLASLALPPLK